jgi:hypothetical protein
MDPVNDSEKKIREAITKADGEKYLQSVSAELRKKSEESIAPPALLDASGQPIKPAEPKAVVSGGDVRTQLELLHEHAERRRLQSARRFGELIKMKENEDLIKVYDVFFTAWELIWWCRMEMSTNPDISDAIIEDLDHIVQAKLYHDKGYSLRKVFNHMRDKGLPIIKDFMAKYESASKVRKVRFEAIKKRTNGKWIQLPFDVPDPERCPQELKPGQVIVLQGNSKATGLASIAACMSIVAQKERFVFFGTEKMDDVDGFEKHSCTFVPEAWWKDIASTNAKMLEGLDATVKDTHIALIVSDLNKLYSSDDRMTENERKGFALKRLFAWAVDNLVSVVVCDIVDKHTTETGVYGFIPYIRVSVENGTLKAEGRPLKTWENTSALDTPKA